MAIFKFSDSNEGEEDSKKPRSTGTTSPCPARNSFYTVESTHVAQFWCFLADGSKFVPRSSARKRTHRVWINKMAAELMLNMIFNTHLKNKIGQ